MNQPTNMKRTGGFTLIELMLSMTFVSVLLLTIAMTVIQIATIYNRGMTLKEVNQSSRDISDDMRRTFAASQVFAINTDKTIDSSDYVRARSGTEIVGGRLCTGSYSYVWNIAKYIESGDPALTKMMNGPAVTDPVRFVRVPDIDKKYCLKDSSGNIINRNINDTDTRAMTDLLDAGDHSLALQTFDVLTTDQGYDASTKQRLYTVIYTIGSGDTSAMRFPIPSDPVGTPIRCYGPSEPNITPGPDFGKDTSNLTYCNVQQFSLVLRVGDTVN